MRNTSTRILAAAAHAFFPPLRDRAQPTEKLLSAHSLDGLAALFRSQIGQLLRLDHFL
jgi:hypothetical protein